MIDDIIHTIQDDLRDTFEKVNTRFDVKDDMMNFVPANGGWTIRKILEHISLTNHYLLILVRKATQKALTKSKPADYSESLKNYSINREKLDVIGQHRSFVWNRPEHMEPTGKEEQASVQQTLRRQLAECLQYLDELKYGEGILVSTMMSVNGLGKIDVYHYIIFLAMHAQRHLQQMELVKQEYETIKRN